jgi:hypothetical protein
MMNTEEIDMNPNRIQQVEQLDFGVTSDGGNGSTQLKQVNVDVTPYNSCNKNSHAG